MTPVQTLMRAKRGVALMFFGLGFGYANWLARIPAVRQTLQLNDRELGLLLLMGGIGALVAFRMAHLFLRRFASRKVAGFSSGLFGLFLFAPAFTDRPYAAGAALFVIGWFNGLMDIALNAQAVEVERRLKKPILAMLHGYFSLGGFFGAACGALAASLAIAPGIHLAGIGVLLMMASWWAGQAMLEDNVATEVAPKPLRLSRPILLLGAVAFCSSVGEGAMAEWIAVYLHDSLGTSMGLAGLGYALFSLAMVTGRLLGDRFSGHMQAHVVLSRCGVLAAGSLALGLYLNTPVTFILSTLGVGAGLCLVIPVVLRTAVRLPGTVPASILSTVATLSYGGFLFGPPVIGLVSEATSLRWALMVVVALCLCLAALATRIPEQLDNASV